MKVELKKIFDFVQRRLLLFIYLFTAEKKKVARESSVLVLGQKMALEKSEFHFSLSHKPQLSLPYFFLMSQVGQWSPWKSLFYIFVKALVFNIILFKNNKE